MRNLAPLALAATFLLAGCSIFDSPPPHRTPTDVPLPAPEKSDVVIGIDRYLVGPLDVLTFRILSLEKARELSTFDVEVDGSGSVYVPFAGLVSVGGKSTGEIRSLVVDKLANVLVNPQVTVTVKDYRSRPITVLGAVEKSGVFYLQKDSVTLTEALSLASGPSVRMGTRAVVTVPGAAGDPTPRRIDVDLVALLLDGNSSWNVRIGPHCIVNVLPAEDLYVGGFVPHPGNFPYHRPLTVTQAVGLAGGVDEKGGSPSKIEVIRTTGATTETFEISLTAIAAGDSPDVYVYPRDTITVRRTFLKALVEFLEALGGHFGAGYAL